MQKILLPIVFVVILFSSCTKDRDLTIPTPANTADTLIYYWDFNGSPSFATSIALNNGAFLSYDWVAGGYEDSLASTTTINARNGATMGNAFRVRTPVTDIILNLPTTNYKNIIVSYAVAKSSSGPALDSVFYTTDGINFKFVSLPSPSSTGAYMVQTDPAYELISYDFSSIASVNNNPRFAVKIVFYQSAGIPSNTASGNDRFDNLTVDGVHL